MTEYEIREQIAYYEDEIQSKRQYIRKQEDKLAELDALKSKLGSLEYEFEGKQTTRRSKLSLLSLLTGKCRIAKGYFDGMSGLLSGSDYRNALSGFDMAAGRVGQEQDLCKANISGAAREIARCNDRIDSLRQQLAATIAEASV